MLPHRSLATTTLGKSVPAKFTQWRLSDPGRGRTLVQMAEALRWLGRRAVREAQAREDLSHS
jgi:hypothetical protein